MPLFAFRNNLTATGKLFSWEMPGELLQDFELGEEVLAEIGNSRLRLVHRFCSFWRLFLGAQDVCRERNSLRVAARTETAGVCAAIRHTGST